MNLYIAEKPSLARAIADALPKPHKRKDGFIELGNGDCVSWCIGHLLEQAEPDAYNPEFKKWRLEHLPILPTTWQLRAKSKTKKQLSILKKLINQADQLIHAGDPDREGQLLVDQVIAHHSVSIEKQNKTKRCLINDMNPSAVKKAIERLRDNKEFAPLSISALARSRADWLYGINMTRAYTIQGQRVGYDGVLSVGRVQTPILGLIVRRDMTIDKFVSVPYYDVKANLITDNGEKFTATWQPSKACQPQLDDDGRVLSKKLANNVASRITNKPAHVKSISEKRKKQAPPLPYNLSALQIDAAKRYSLSAKQVLDICQSLYERHKLITYPRSSSRHLPLEHYSRATNVIDAIAKNSVSLNNDSLKNFSNDADVKLKSLAWNDAKVEAHHAIVPTEKATNLSNLNLNEKNIYDLIARQYLQQFFPKHEYSETKLAIIIEGGLFTTNARRIILVGWKTLSVFTNLKSHETSAITEKSLPTLKQSEKLHCHKGEVLEKQTKSPLHFTDATLLSAVTGIARHVKNPDVRKILRETDGLGTEATRANIIELLFKRGYLLREKKSIISTPAGKGLILSLPENATQPDMTAEWESKLNDISKRQGSYQSFMTNINDSINRLLNHVIATPPTALKGTSTSASPMRKNRKKHYQKKTE